MKSFAPLALSAAALLALSACGSTDGANEEAQADNVELPAEEAVGGLDADATPVADASATATATDAASAAATGAASVAASEPAAE